MSDISQEILHLDMNNVDLQHFKLPSSIEEDVHEVFTNFSDICPALYADGAADVPTPSSEVIARIISNDLNRDIVLIDGAAEPPDGSRNRNGRKLLKKKSLKSRLRRTARPMSR